jgi:hypothetical protein
MTATAPTTVEYFFDPVCPWTWMTSRWLVDASAAAGTEVRWRNLSLAVVNAGREIPERFRTAQQAAVRAHRVIAALLADGRNDLVGDFYTEWGRRFHHDGEHGDPGLARGVADAVGAAAWAGAVDEERWDEAVEASTKEGQSLAGGDVGSPVLAFGEPRVGFFGPIVSPAPKGAAALALFTHVVALATTPAFFELKRGRPGGPELGPRP